MGIDIDVMGNNKMKIVFATGNMHKLKEINEIAKGSNIEFILPPAGFDPIETGKSRKIIKKYFSCR